MLRGALYWRRGLVLIGPPRVHGSTQRGVEWGWGAEVPRKFLGIRNWRSLCKRKNGSNESVVSSVYFHRIVSCSLLMNLLCLSLFLRGWLVVGCVPAWIRACQYTQFVWFILQCRIEALIISFFYRTNATYPNLVIPIIGQNAEGRSTSNNGWQRMPVNSNRSPTLTINCMSSIYHHTLTQKMETMSNYFYNYYGRIIRTRKIVCWKELCCVHDIISHVLHLLSCMHDIYM